jgi:hypothetical protein
MPRMTRAVIAAELNEIQLDIDAVQSRIDDLLDKIVGNESKYPTKKPKSKAKAK